MNASARSAPARRPMVNDWTGVRTHRVEYEPRATIFAQGDPATSVMYIEGGTVRLSVLSHAGKEAVVALLGSGVLLRRGLPSRAAAPDGPAAAMVPCTIIGVEKAEMVRHLHAQPAFANRFLTHMLTRNIRIEEDLIDQLFNSSEKRLARRSRPPCRPPDRADSPVLSCTACDRAALVYSMG